MALATSKVDVTLEHNTSATLANSETYVSEGAKRTEQDEVDSKDKTIERPELSVKTSVVEFTVNEPDQTLCPVNIVTEESTMEEKGKDTEDHLTIISQQCISSNSTQHLHVQRNGSLNIADEGIKIAHTSDLCVQEVSIVDNIEDLEIGGDKVESAANATSVVNVEILANVNGEHQGEDSNSSGLEANEQDVGVPAVKITLDGSKGGDDATRAENEEEITSVEANSAATPEDDEKTSKRIKDNSGCADQKTVIKAVDSSVDKMRSRNMSTVREWSEENEAAANPNDIILDVSPNNDM